MTFTVTSGSEDRQAGRHADRQTDATDATDRCDRQAGRNVDRQTDATEQADRQADRQKDKTHTHRERERCPRRTKTSSIHNDTMTSVLKEKDPARHNRPPASPPASRCGKPAAASY